MRFKTYWTLHKKVWTGKLLSVPCKDNCIKERERQNLCPLLTGTRAQCQHALSAFSACLLAGFVAPQLCELHPCALGERETHSRCYCVSHQFHTKQKKQRRERNDSLVCPLRGHY